MRETMRKQRLEAGSHPLVSVVIVNYNSGLYLADCVRSVMDSTYPKKELIVVDNGSTDGSLERATKAFPKLRTVRNRKNLGYSRAGNIGISMSGGEFAVIMNPDTVVDPGWLDALVDAAARHPRGAFFQPKILLMGNRSLLNSAGNMIHVAGFGVCRGIALPDGEPFQEELEVSYASGACNLARLNALKEIGLMEELLLAYGEDKDWGWRALMMGWRSVYVPSSRILHKWSPTLGASPAKFYLLEFERLFSVCKNYSKRTLVLLLPVLIVVEGFVVAYAIVHGWIGEKLRSYADVLRLRHILAERRRGIQARRIMPDSMLIRRFVEHVDHPYLGSLSGILSRLIHLTFTPVKNLI